MSKRSNIIWVLTMYACLVFCFSHNAHRSCNM